MQNPQEEVDDHGTKSVHSDNSQSGHELDRLRNPSTTSLPVHVASAGTVMDLRASSEVDEPVRSAAARNTE